MFYLLSYLFIIFHSIPSHVICYGLSGVGSLGAAASAEMSRLPRPQSPPPPLIISFAIMFMVSKYKISLFCCQGSLTQPPACHSQDSVEFLGSVTGGAGGRGGWRRKRRRGSPLSTRGTDEKPRRARTYMHTCARTQQYPPPHHSPPPGWREATSTRFSSPLPRRSDS